MVFNLAEDDTYGYECGVFVLNDFFFNSFCNCECRNRAFL